MDSSDADYQRGFVISFPGGAASLTVSAEANSLDYADARAAAAGDLQLFKQRGRKIVSSDFEPTELDGRHAETLRVRYTCLRSGTEYLSVQTIALSAGRGYVYEISWEGLPPRFDSDRSTVDRLKQTWRFLKAK